MITVIDYGAGNLRSVGNALKYLKAPHSITSHAAALEEAEAVLLPGVGHFGQMIRSLQDLGLLPVLRGLLRRGVPYLGICLGMHALYEQSEEAPAWPGLGFFHGSIRRFPEGLKVPHMGWNQLEIAPGSRLFQGIGGTPFVYFAPSHYLPAEQTPEGKASKIAALADYGRPFVAAVEANGVYGVQFHPEKSGDVGLKILQNFLEASRKSQSRKAGTEGGQHAR